jgi:signal transduction histidine kinase
VAVPLVIVGWLGARLADDERASAAARERALVEARLADTEAAVQRAVDTLRRALMSATRELPVDADALRARARADPLYRELLVLDADGRVLFPPPDGPISERERRLLDRTRALREDGALAADTADTETGARASDRDHGWRPWYWGGGLNLIFWRRLSDGRTAAIEIDRARLVAAVISDLPVTREDRAGGQITVIDADGAPLYIWGETPEGGAHRTAERRLAAPLAGWTLSWAGPVLPAGGLPMSVVVALMALGVALAGLGVWFWRESTRALREAAERVTFVNQVSHELKTPLTNIRMYAELLEGEIDEDDTRAHRHAGIIAGESQRLSRLIGNILTFARQQRGEAIRIRRGPGVVDTAVAEIVEQFRPSLDAVGIEPTVDLNAPVTVRLDADALGQILGNLLSNVEKYAATGGSVEIGTRGMDGTTLITVADRGPGIPPEQRARVFEPFARVSDSLTDGVTGTGIGLGLARDLARLHGGDLVLRGRDGGGCVFEITLATPREGDA